MYKTIGVFTLITEIGKAYTVKCRIDGRCR